MSESLKQHWDRVYETRDPTKVSWYQPMPEKSIALIRETEAPPPISITGACGGTSVSRISAIDFSGIG